MNKLSDKYLLKSSESSGKFDLDWEIFWSYVNMIYYSKIFTSSFIESRKDLPITSIKGSDTITTRKRKKENTNVAIKKKKNEVSVEEIKSKLNKVQNRNKELLRL